jgi:hypothetical protein
MQISDAPGSNKRHDGIYLETVVGAGVYVAVAFAKKYSQPINHGPNKSI